MLRSPFTRGVPGMALLSSQNRHSPEGLMVTGYGLLVTGYWLQVTGYGLPVTRYNPVVQEESLFGKIAVEEGFLTQAQLDSALTTSPGRSITDVLIDRGVLKPAQVQIIRDIQ